MNAHEHSLPANVPVFNCIVYVSHDDSGMVRTRVANLPGFETSAVGEREALTKIVTALKQRVAELSKRGESIPWIDPPVPPMPGEQTRFIPVHL